MTTKSPEFMNIEEMIISPGNMERIYLNYVDAYMTIKEFAEKQQIETWYAQLLIDAGREAHNNIIAAHARIDETAGYGMGEVL